MQASMSASRLLPLLTALGVEAGVLSPAADMGDLKAALNACGINQRGWRLVTKFGDALVLPFDGLHRRATAESHFRTFCAFVRLVQQCEMDVPPPPDLVRALAMLSFPQGRSLDDLPVGLFRAAWLYAVKEQYAGYDLLEFADKSIPDVVSWYFQSGQEAAPPTNRDWAWYDEQALDWSLRCTHKLSLDRWPSLLITPVESRGVMAVELLDVQTLGDEGAAMNHCVGSYFLRCDANEYRVFSLRKRVTGERVATRGIKLDEHWWVVDQVRGPYNSNLPGWVWKLAQYVVLHCNRRKDGPVVTQAQRSLFPEHRSRPSNRGCAA